MLKKLSLNYRQLLNLSCARPFYAIRPLDTSFFNSVKAILINTFAIGKMVKILFGVPDSSEDFGFL